MEASQYVVNVVGQYVDQISKGLDKSTKAVNRFKINVNSIGNAVGKSLAKHKSFNSLWDETGNKIKKNIPVMDKLNFSTDKLTKINQKNARQQTWVRKQYNMGAQGLVNNASRVNETAARFTKFGDVMKMDVEDWKKFNAEGGRFNTKGARLANTTRKLSHGMRGFKMEMLGIMFFGMGMQKFFSGLLKPALETVGIFELWKTTLELLFLPIALLLFQFLMPILTWIMNWSDETKLLVGKLVLLGLALGTILFLGGMLLLGIGSLIMAFSGIMNIVDKFIPDINVAGVNVSSFIEAGMGISILSGLFELFGGVVNSVLGKILELQFVKDIFEKMGIAIDDQKTPWQNFKKLIFTVWDKIKEKLGIDNKEGGIAGWIDTLKEKFNDWFDTIKEKAEDLGLNEIITSMKDIGGTIKEITPSIETMAKALKTVADLLGYIIDGWILVKTAWDQNLTGDQAQALWTRLRNTRINENLPTWKEGNGYYSPGSSASGGGGGGAGNSVSVSPTYNINVLDKSELEKLLQTINSQLVSQIARDI